MLCCNKQIMEQRRKLRRLLFSVILFLVLLSFLLRKANISALRETNFRDFITLEFKKPKLNFSRMTWSQKPKETWNKHFQSLFKKYNLTEMRKGNSTLKCNSNFRPVLTDNMDIISKYSFNVSQTYLRDLSLDEKGIRQLVDAGQYSCKLPVLVTAASSNHYNESQGLIQTYHQKLLPFHKYLKMIYYDIGLKDKEREDVARYCKCEVRIFNFTNYPEHIRELAGYAWKPIIIQTVLKEYDMVMWNDASIRFVRDSLDKLSVRVKETGFIGNTGGGSICTRTSKKMFDYLKETPCLYNIPELQSGWMTISRNEFTLNYIMKPWVSCSLDSKCMNYEGSRKLGRCPRGTMKCNLCHRFDQSMLGILVTRLFQDRRSIVEDKRPTMWNIRRGHRVNYFQTLQ